MPFRVVSGTATFPDPFFTSTFVCTKEHFLSGCCARVQHHPVQPGPEVELSAVKEPVHLPQHASHLLLDLSEEFPTRHDRHGFLLTVGNRVVATSVELPGASAAS